MITSLDELINKSERAKVNFESLDITVAENELPEFPSFVLFVAKEHLIAMIELLEEIREISKDTKRQMLSKINKRYYAACLERANEYVDVASRHPELFG